MDLLGYLYYSKDELARNPNAVTCGEVSDEDERFIIYTKRAGCTQETSNRIREINVNWYNSPEELVEIIAPLLLEDEIMIIYV